MSAVQPQSTGGGAATPSGPSSAPSAPESSSATDASNGATPDGEGGGVPTGAAVVPSDGGPHTPLPPVAVKTDKITEVQDTIDSLSLSLFEALRGLRDAVAPEEAAAQQQLAAAAMGGAAPGAGGHANGAGAAEEGGAAGRSSTAPVDDDPDYDDFLVQYHNRDPAAVALVAKAKGNAIPRSREEYVKLLARAEMEKDAELASRLAEEVLSKSELVDELVAGLPGMGRTKAMQMERIQELITKNAEAERELESAYEEALRRREEVRKALRDASCKALGIEEEGR